MTRRRLADRSELAAHLEWARIAIRDRHLDARLILEALVDAIEATAALTPGPPREPAPPSDPVAG
jgi:hypothetical protein